MNHKRRPDLVDQFIDTAPLSNRRAAEELLRLCLRNAHDFDGLLEGSWIQFADTERYIHFSGRGYGASRTLRLVENFVQFLADERHLSDWDRRRLFSLVDDAREGNGLKRRTGATAHDRPVFEGALESIGQRFAATLGHPVHRSVAPGAVGLLASMAGRGATHVYFGQLDPDMFLANALLDSSTDGLEANRCLFEIAAHFYRWLRSLGWLDAKRAEEVSARFTRAALSLPHSLPSASVAV